PLLMGILNVTPDSFSDGGKYFSPQKALQHAKEMARAGADIIDIGAESTRPGARAVTIEEEWQRLEAVLKKIKANLALPVSIDTYKSEIAQLALDAGVDMVNDISGLTFDPEMVKVVAEAGCPLVIMHIKGTPRDMQIDPRYDNLMEELYRFFLRQIEYAQSHGISQLIVDPGIGFGKRLQDNLEIIRRLKEFRGLGYPILVGPSRKSFIGKILDVESEKRMIGSAAAVALALNNGAKVIRVHDVHEMKQVSEIVQAINNPIFFMKE
ncbi:MAG: dihydropteroate synthase, partial [Calditrichia bacterium]|nr:dihydropteroate synthase [Calditrichia bacterium]